jgi:alpha-tubulin suppressor-like RCC1 family protein
MSQQKAQLISPIDTFTTPGLNVTGVVTSTSFVGNSSGTATGLSGTPNITAGIVTAVTYYGDGSGLTGAAVSAFVGQSTTSQSPTTTIDLSSGNVIYFTHDTDTTVAFANTSTVEKVKFIRIKDATSTPRNITWPDSVLWDGGSAPTLITNPRTTAAQTFNLTTRDSGATWYAYQEVSADPQSVSLFSWGRNVFGELGQNNRTYYSSPVQIPGTTWSSISSFNYGGFATKTDGTLWAWGYNTYGALGQGNTIYQSSPVQVPGITWSSIAGGGNHSLATKTDVTLWAWGRNEYGQLGQSNLASQSSPVQIPGTSWTSISGGNFHSLATKTDGTLWAWGGSFLNFGELGQNNRVNQSSPVQIPGTTWSSIAGGGNHSLATKTDGTLWAWGSGFNGRLGQNNTTQYSSPVQIPGTTWSSISGGNAHSVATKTDGTLWTWGINQRGQLGQGDRTQYSSPVQVPGTTWSFIDASRSQRTLSIKTDGTLWIWGYNDVGQLGQGDRTYYSSPVQVPGTTWSSASVNGVETLALKSE